MTCAQMGGPATCNTMISGSTADEMVKNGMVHIEAEHPEMAADIKKMPKEAMDKWMAEFQPKFDALPEM